MKWIWGIGLVCLEWWLGERLFVMDTSYRRRAAAAGLLALLWAGAFAAGIPLLGILAGCVAVDFYLLFYSENTRPRLLYFAANGAVTGCALLAGYLLCPEDWLAVAFPAAAGFAYLTVLYFRGQARPAAAVCLAALTLGIVWVSLRGEKLAAGLMAGILVVLLEKVYSGYAADFRKNTAEFQDQVVQHHYEEVRAVYLNMRGWRHDYHNHLQSLKAYLVLGETGKARDYLDELEQDLNQVDWLVKSGNLMMDAILNAKLSLAAESAIAVDCKVTYPETMSIGDTDLCVIVGNLLDNAIESCRKVEEKQRFIRIYGTVLRHQMYLSVVNAAKEELNFNEQHYISEKRGEHGHGMKRVHMAVERYGGYLNLKNEPGVFASEVLLPLE